MDKTCAQEREEYQDGDAIYETQCGRSYMFIEGNIKDNDITYCPFCGGTIKEVLCGQET